MAQSREPPPDPHVPPMVLLSVTWNYVGIGGGDFDGQHFAVKPSPDLNTGEVFFAPELNGGTGFEVDLCWLILCFAYARAALDARLVAIAPLESAVLHRVSFELRPGYRVTPELVPYATATIDVDWMNLKGAHAVVNVASDTVTFDEATTSLSGGGVGLGLGLLVQPVRYFGIDLAFGYRWYWFGSIDSEQLDDSFNGRGFFVEGGPALAF
jgi:hypothetical protein